MKRVVFAACALVSLLGVVRASPNADTITEDIASRYSNDIYEDARLDVPDLVRKYGYPLEVHEVTTPDGYILQMHRIPHGRGGQNNGVTVFVMHGLMCSSADWVLMGPGKGIAYLLADEGYDVWMGNARGNYYSRRHLSLRPDAFLNTDFWDFSWDEIGNIDLPTMIDYALEQTGQSRLHYIGHSQGTTSFFVMTSLRPEYNNKIISMHALAPVAYMANVQSPLLRFISTFSSSLETLTSMMGIGEFLPNSQIMTWAGQAMCEEEATFQPVCTSIMFLVGGHNEPQLNTTMLPVKLGHTPAGSSTKQFAHYGQGISSGRFARYDHGFIGNRRRYGSRNPPSYNLQLITCPTFLHYSDSDPMAHVNDVFQLFREIRGAAGIFRIQDPNFSHLDFMWAIDAKALLYDRVMNLMRAFN